MKQYIGTEIVQAEPAYRVKGPGVYDIIPTGECLNETEIAPDEAVEIEGVTAEEGYKVQYADGYESWSPKDVFEAAYRRTDGLNFGLALEACKMGKKIARAGWNGKNQYVELADCIGYVNAAGQIINLNHHAIGNKCLAFVGTSGAQMGWLASQADMLADDWHIVG